MNAEHKALVERIKLTATCVYAATEIGPAADISDCLKWAATAIESLSERAERAEAQLATARQLVSLQALNEGLWFTAQTAPEGYLQRALRALHALVEGEALGGQDDQAR